MIAHIAASVPGRYAPDMSGLITTTSQIAAVFGIATFGTAYLSLAPHPSPRIAMHAFTLITAGFAFAALLAAAAAYQSTRRHAPVAVADHTQPEAVTPSPLPPHASAPQLCARPFTQAIRLEDGKARCMWRLMAAAHGPRW
ncbi:MAG: hypothetical protein ACRDHP_03485 [Ktedonobacterales bacterium]